MMCLLNASVLWYMYPCGAAATFNSLHGYMYLAPLLLVTFPSRRLASSTSARALAKMPWAAL